MITVRFLVSTSGIASNAFFAPVRGIDFGVQARFAWIGFDPKLERVAYQRRSGRAVIINDVPILPPAPFAAAAVRSDSRRLRAAIERAFEDVESAERMAIGARKSEDVDDAVRSVDLFHPVVITSSKLWSHEMQPLASVRLERMHPINGREWIDVVNHEHADTFIDEWQRWYEEKLL